MKTLMLVLFSSLNVFGSGTVEPRSPQEAYHLVESKKAVIVDVREKEETKGGVISGAILLPLSTLESDPKALDAFLNKVSKNQEIILYCRSGRRAGKVAEMILQKGHKATNLGGFDQWVKAKLPTSTFEGK